MSRGGERLVGGVALVLAAFHGCPTHAAPLFGPPVVGVRKMIALRPMLFLASASVAIAAFGCGDKWPPHLYPRDTSEFPVERIVAANWTTKSGEFRHVFLVMKAGWRPNPGGGDRLWFWVANETVIAPFVASGEGSRVVYDLGDLSDAQLRRTVVWLAVALMADDRNGSQIAREDILSLERIAHAGSRVLVLGDGEELHYWLSTVTGLPLSRSPSGVRRELSHGGGL